MIPGINRTGGYYGRYGRGSTERKFFDTTSAAAPANSTMTLYNPMIIPQDDTESGRDGRKITIKSISVRGHWLHPSQTAVANTSNICKIMIVQDTQTNGAAFTATDLLVADNIYSFHNLANSSRFKVLRSKTYSISVPSIVPTGAAYATGEVIRSINMNVRCNIPIEFDSSATTGAITTVRSNSIWIVTQCLSHQETNFSIRSRVRFVDM